MIFPALARLTSSIAPIVSKAVPKASAPIQRGYGGLIKSNPVKVGALGAGVGLGGIGVSSAIGSVQQSINQGGGGILAIGAISLVLVLIFMMRGK